MASYRAELSDLIHERTSIPYNELRDIWLASEDAFDCPCAEEISHGQDAKAREEIVSVETAIVTNSTCAVAY